MSSAFKSYDVRGVYPTEINEDLAYKLGRAFVQFLNVDEVVVGMDGRTSSPSLSKALIDGITDQGAKAVDIGFCTHPALMFADGFYKFPAGIMITASGRPGGRENPAGRSCCGRSRAASTPSRPIDSLSDCGVRRT